MKRILSPRALPLAVALLCVTSVSALFAVSETPVISAFVPHPEGGFFVGTFQHGVLFTPDSGLPAEPRNSGFPIRPVYPWTETEYRKISGLGSSLGHPDHLAAVTPSSLYLTSDAGRTWRPTPLSDPVRPTNYLTSVALSPSNPARVVLGTSFNGIFESPDAGRSWRRLPLQNSPLFRGANFYEEIAGVAINPADERELYVSLGFGYGLFRYHSTTGRVTQVALPDGIRLGSLYFDGAGRLHGVGPHGHFRRDADQWHAVETPVSLGRPGPTPEARERLAAVADLTGIYVRPDHASGARLEAHLDFVRRHGMNSIVVDVKDDEGYITYNSQVELFRRTRAVRPRFDMAELITRAHAEGISVIARVVVFKDAVLFRYDNNRHAVWNTQANAPWGNLIREVNAETQAERMVQREFWVDPFDPFVWEYNIALGRELQELGVDEIQFDYIRFPSDGNLALASYRSQRPGMTRIDALESFLRRVREEIAIPISTDLYGFNSWYRMGNWIGQSIEMVSHYVDVISPMYYPSHFPRDFLRIADYLEWAEAIYYQGTRRSRELVEGRSLIRPYVQAFLIGGELSMERPRYTEYLMRQLEGSRNACASGYTLWNFSNRYYMVPDRIGPFNREWAAMSGCPPSIADADDGEAES